MGHTINPSWATGGFRFENDDGTTLDNSTFISGQNSNVVLAADTNFRLRINFGEDAAQNTGTSFTPRLQYRINGGSWNNVTGSSPVQVSASSALADNATSSTERLTDPPGAAATYVQTRFDEGDAVMAAVTPSNQYYEYVFNLTIDSAQVSVSDALQFQIVDNAGSETLTTQERIPQATVGTPPDIQTGNWRIYNDDGTTWSNMTAIEAENTSAEVSLDTNFMLRYSLAELDNSTVSNRTLAVQLQYRVNGGSWTNVTTTSAVKGVNSNGPAFADGATAGGVGVNDVLSPPSGTGMPADADTVVWDENGSAGNFIVSLDWFEYAHILQLDSASISAGDSIEFRYEPHPIFTITAQQSTPTVTVPGGNPTGTAAWTESADTMAASGTVLLNISGTSAWTENADTMAASGEQSFIATSAWTEEDDTVSASGILSFTGSSSWTEDDDTAAASGAVEFIGTSAWTEDDDTMAASGTVLQPVTGTAAWTEESDTVVSSGVMSFIGTSSWTESDDTASASGSITFSGSAAWTEDSDTLASSGELSFTGSSAWTEESDTLAASGEQSFIGSSTWTEADDLMAASGSTGFTGSSAWTEDDDTLSASGQVTFVGTSAFTEDDDTLAASGEVIQPITGTSAWTEDPDTMSASGEQQFSGAAAWSEDPDTMAASGSVGSGVFGTASWTEDNDTFAASGLVQINISGTSAWTEDADTVNPELLLEDFEGVFPASDDYSDWGVWSSGASTDPTCVRSSSHVTEGSFSWFVEKTQTQVNSAGLEVFTYNGNNPYDLSSYAGLRVDVFVETIQPNSSVRLWVADSTFDGDEVATPPGVTGAFTLTILFEDIVDFDANSVNDILVYVGGGSPFGFYVDNLRAINFDGTVTNLGTSAITEADDTMAAAGLIEFFGTSSWTEENDTMAALGLIEFTGAAAWTESDDDLTSVGTVENPVFGSAAWTEGDDTLSASGIVGTLAANPDDYITNLRRRRRSWI